MSSAIFALAIFAAFGFLIARRIKARIHLKRFQNAPGQRSDNPIILTDYADLDGAHRKQRCVCGGRLERISEGGTGGKRFIVVECWDCEEASRIYFDMSGVPN